MSWIILALTLGASITSIIHGVFMLFGSLAVTDSGIFVNGLPPTMLAGLPVVSAVFALIGGIAAFNQSKWGALFLFVAAGLCVPARDTWLYGGLYFFAALLCFLVSKKNRETEMIYGDYDYDDNGYGSGTEDVEADYYYDTPAIPPADSYDGTGKQAEAPAFSFPDLKKDNINADTSFEEALKQQSVPKIRRRMSKACPECGEIVSRDSHYCPTCGAKLSVLTEDDNIDIEKLNEQLLTPVPTEEFEQVQEQAQAQEQEETQNIQQGDNPKKEDEENMSYAESIPNYRVLVRPERNSTGMGRTLRNDVTSQEFTRYTSKAKKRGRSAGRKIASMLLLFSAVGGALYFLLGLRKLPPGDLPPIARTEVVRESARESESENLPPVKSVQTTETDSKAKGSQTVAEPVVAVAENILPNFEPELQPRNGIITGSSVNVRADHTTSSARVTRMKVNSRVEILGTFNVPSGQHSGIWYNIRTGNNEGWVYGRYLQPVGSGLPSGYSVALLKTFGSNKAQMTELLGTPTRSTGSSVEWPGLTATLKGDEITRIRITSPNRELQNGLKIGMSQTALQQIMGYPSSVNNRTMNYNENGKTGLSIQLDRNNSISSITVNEI